MQHQIQQSNNNIKYVLKQLHNVHNLLKSNAGVNSNCILIRRWGRQLVIHPQWVHISQQVANLISYSVSQLCVNLPTWISLNNSHTAASALRVC